MITQEKERPLNIYKASAGSGKTHLLTGFYIKLLFVNELLPETHQGEMRFSEILAVTFTNKATAEMKTRIIDELYLLSTDPTTSHYWEDVTKAGTSKSDTRAVARIKEKATQLLVQILNEYSSFNISTIDSFFQRIVRSFARELNVPGNYEVELDSNRVFDAAVSAFMDKLDEKGNPRLFAWMKEFATNRIEEGSAWDVRKALLDNAEKVLSSETYRQHSDDIQAFTFDEKALTDYAKMLQDIVTNWRKKLKELGERGVNFIKDNNLDPNDFKYKGSGFISVYEKWQNGDVSLPGSRFIQGTEDPPLMYKKKPSQTVIDQLQALMQECLNHLQGTPYIHYRTALAIRANFYELGILAYIDREATQYCNDHNFMLLSSTTELLNRLIAQDDAPFIYEKTGTRIHSYMIDEFQDTSGMQWSNFMPLISNSLAERYQNLIVGDVKQSIYRWRGGDWSLLDSEINSYEPSSHHDDTKSLIVNWRSHPAIVDFNNEFFPDLAKQMDNILGNGSTRIQQIYADVRQKLPKPEEKKFDSQGLVEISFLAPKDEDGNPIEKPTKNDYVLEAQRRLPEKVIELQRNGYQASDITILCRYNAECQWAAEAMLRYKAEHPQCPYTLDIISSEALHLAARPVIQVLINLMRHLATPQSPILSAIANTAFRQLHGVPTDQALMQHFAVKVDDRAFRPELAHRPLYEMVEQLIAALPSTMLQTDAPYLQAFRDVVLEYASMKSSDLTGFLEWWDQSGHKRSISLPEGQDAIQILSVHKSKGLGKPAIVLPFASWDMDIDTSHGELLWCKPNVAPFALQDHDLLLPIKLSKELPNTIFSNDFQEERERAVIDNINTAYVAFTRAKEAMVILAPAPTDTSTRLEKWLKKYCEERCGQDPTLTLGDWQRGEKHRKSNKADNSEQKDDNAKDNQQKDELPSDDFTQSELPQITILHDPRKPDVTAKRRGTYIHAVLQDIKVADESHSIIERLYMRGDIDPSVIDQAEMTATIDRLLAIPEASQWFRSGLQVMNELSIMDGKGQLRRPDRIVIDESGHATVIDYKTGSSHTGYKTQVRSYMRLLRQMGLQQVDGYLLYIKDEKIVKV